MTQFLKNPISLILGFVIAVVISAYFPQIGKSMEIPAGIYLSVLQMCVIPLLISSLVRATSAIASDTTFSTHSVKFIMNQTAMSFLLVFIAIVLSNIIPVGHYLAQTGGLIQFATFENGLKPLYTSMNGQFLTQTSIMDIVRTIFTNNIFDSLSKSIIIQIIFFSILVGCAAGRLQNKQKETFTHFVGGVENVFKTIIGWVTLLLPIGVIFVFSFNLHNLSKDILTFMLPAILFFILSMLFILIITHLVLAKKLNKGIIELFKDIKAPLIVAFSTGSIMASLPSYIQTLTQDLRLDERFSLLYGPIGLALYRYGNLFYYAFLAILLSQIFSVPLFFHDYVVITVLSFFLSFAAVSSGIINVGLIALILSPINVPSALPLVLLVAMDPLIDPIRAVFSVYTNIFCISFFTKTNK